MKKFERIYGIWSRTSLDEPVLRARVERAFGDLVGGRLVVVNAFVAVGREEFDVIEMTFETATGRVTVEVFGGPPPRTLGVCVARLTP